jgi:DNA-binding XRE family transcriptional regulator
VPTDQYFVSAYYNGGPARQQLAHNRLFVGRDDPRMTSDLLRRVGAALYGQHWHSELAHTLGVNRHTVQRWEAGDSPIPPTLPRNLARLVAARQDELGKLYRELASR